MTELHLPLWRRLAAEFLGTGLLVAIVVGSGIAAQRLSPGDTGLQLLENSVATTLGLAVLIFMLAPVSGAHFNPVVTIADRIIGGGGTPPAAYIPVQMIGAIGGALLANAMFGLPPQISTTDRVSPGQLLAEVVATAILIVLIFSLARTGRSALAAPMVAAYVGAAYWFTSSTAFINPAVTVGRIFSDTFAGIAPGSAVPFLAAQLVGAAVGIGLLAVLFPRTNNTLKGTP